MKIILKLFSLKFLASMLGLSYSILQMRIFGATKEMDTFFVAMSGLYLITSIVQGGQLAEVYLPEYINQKNKYGVQAAHNLLSSIINRIVIYTSIGLSIIYALAPNIINILGAGFSEDQKSLGTNLLSLSLIVVLFSVISSFINSTLNAESIFGRSEITSLFNGVISLIFLSTSHEKFGILSLIYALLIGKISEFLIGGYYLIKIGYRHKFIWITETYNINNFLKILKTTSTYVGATQIYLSTITAMGSYLPEGTLSIFNYISQLSLKGFNLIMGPITTVFFSRVSKLNLKQKKNLLTELSKPIKAVYLINLSIFIYVLTFSSEIINIIWDEKGLNHSQTSFAVNILCLNFIGYIFNSCGLIFRKTVVAIGDAKKLYSSWIFTQILSVFFAYFSIRHFGIKGLESILLINMILMSSASYYTFMKLRKDCKKILSSTILNIRFGTFTCLIISGSVVLSSAFTNDKSITYYVLKTTVISTFLLSMISIFFRKNILLYYQIFSKKYVLKH